MQATRAIAPARLALMGSCSRTPAGNAGSEPPAQWEAPGLGEVMTQVGRRFEVAGRAAAANRFELAAFEVGELQELFPSRGNQVVRAMRAIVAIATTKGEQ
jgi:hypothetical protein